MLSIHHKKLCFDTENILFKKIKYIAKYDGQTPAQTIEQMMLEWIRAFEEVEGIIPIY